MARATILVAEDDKNLSEILKTKLVSLGYEVITAYTGEEAERLMIEKKPDLCTLDIMMPQKNGIEVLESKLNNPAIKNIPVIVMSNLGQQADIERARTLGAKDYIVKADISLTDFVTKVDQFLSARGAA